MVGNMILNHLWKPKNFFSSLQLEETPMPGWDVQQKSRNAMDFNLDQLWSDQEAPRRTSRRSKNSET
ncbi:hypothetical protein XELAEV_18042107mg [Xenopus laevis]|uniref:Uncharacterized protein n=1 Tax=Xenopus laevis TaxID=8355 RepID=A0A974C468_XENLA|nr:hypothetical protein XELAEV_18042107mg [Xenopus laevis]